MCIHTNSEKISWYKQNCISVEKGGLRPNGPHANRSINPRIRHEQGSSFNSEYSKKENCFLADLQVENPPSEKRTFGHSDEPEDPTVALLSFLAQFWPYLKDCDSSLQIISSLSINIYMVLFTGVFPVSTTLTFSYITNCWLQQ